MYGLHNLGPAIIANDNPFALRIGGSRTGVRVGHSFDRWQVTFACQDPTLFFSSPSSSLSVSERKKERKNERIKDLYDRIELWIL